MRTGRWALAAALIFGLAAAALSYSYVKRVSRPVPVVARNESVVVAKRAILPRTLITPEMVELKNVPAGLVHPDAARALKDVIGVVTRSEIMSGEQVLGARLIKPGQATGLAISIPADKRAVTVGVNEVKGVAGFVRPGDRVDILATFESDKPGQEKTVTILQDVEVLAIAQEMEKKGDDKARVTTSATIAVTPEQAEKLTLAEETGDLRLALRPVVAAEPKESVGPGDSKPKGITTNEILGGTPKIAPVGTVAAPVLRPRAAKPSPEPPRAVEVIRGEQKSYIVLDEKGEAK